MSRNRSADGGAYGATFPKGYSYVTVTRRSGGDIRTISINQNGTSKTISPGVRTAIDPEYATWVGVTPTNTDVTISCKVLLEVD